MEKTYSFSLEVMSLCREIREYELASQLWRAGTSIGANVEEAQAAQSRADFRSKMSIAAKEAREAHYWLRLVRDAKVLDGDEWRELKSGFEAKFPINSTILGISLRRKVMVQPLKMRGFGEGGEVWNQSP